MIVGNIPFAANQSDCSKKLCSFSKWPYAFQSCIKRTNDDVSFLINNQDGTEVGQANRPYRENNKRLQTGSNIPVLAQICANGSLIFT